MIKLEEQCFWPGPRPVRDEDRKTQLRGRDDDTAEIINEIHSHGLTVLMGESGVGKSSMLDSLIRPQLAAEGFRVLICHEWSSSGVAVSDINIDAFIAKKVADQLPDGMIGGASLASQIDRRFGQRGVLILDQFEELIRHEPRLFKAVQDWIIDAVKKYDFHIVVSLRSEYEHRLRDLRIDDDYQRIDIYLEPVSAIADIRDIIKAGRDEQRSNDDVITEETVDEICRLWSLADGGHPWSGVGLLHLQAMLYVLWSRATDRGAARVELVDLKQMLGGPIAAAGTKDAPDSARKAFARALSDAVQLRLDRGRTVYEAQREEQDNYLSEGVRSQIARMADHLTSGGYKVDQDRWHLARLVLEEELKILGIDDEDGGPAWAIFSAFASVVDTETHDAEDMDWSDDVSAASLPAKGVDWLIENRSLLVENLPKTEGIEPWDLDQSDVASGPMMGLPPEHVLVEELRRFFFALEWLRVNSLINLTTAGEGTTVIALVHDGFGRGLRDWAQRNDELAEQALTLLTAAIGETYSWQTKAIGGTPEKYRLVPNMRWRACRVSKVDFEHLVFMNCDFRESTFVDCSFRGVTFVNCLLDGVTFRRSRILGAAELTETADSDDYEFLPSFTLGDENTARILSWYREETDEAARSGLLVSESSGVPVVGDDMPDDREVFEWTARTGGLVMYGGRLSSVMFAKCEFEDDSLLGFVTVAGTSLEIAEQVGGRIYLSDVQVRGLTISANVSVDDALKKAAKPTEMHVSNSVIQNVWISTGLDGFANFANTRVWQVFNASDDFEFKFTDSQYYGLVNTGTPDETNTEETGLSLTGVGEAINELIDMSRKIDYRSSPAAFDAQLVKRRPRLPKPE